MWGIFLRRLGINSLNSHGNTIPLPNVKDIFASSRQHEFFNRYHRYGNSHSRFYFVKNILTNELIAEAILNTNATVFKKKNRKWFFSHQFSSGIMKGIQNFLLYDRSQYKSWADYDKVHHVTFWDNYQLAIKNAKTDANADVYDPIVDSLLLFKPSTEPIRTKYTPSPRPSGSNGSNSSNQFKKSQAHGDTVNIWRSFLQDRGLHHLYSRISGEHAEEKQMKREFEAGFKKWEQQQKEGKRVVKNKAEKYEEAEISGEEKQVATNVESAVSSEADAEYASIESGEAEAEFVDAMENVIIDSVLDA